VNRHSILTRPILLEGASLYVSDEDINFSLWGGYRMKWFSLLGK
jgi:hypothetical protein